MVFEILSLFFNVCISTYSSTNAHLKIFFFHTSSHSRLQWLSAGKIQWRRLFCSLLHSRDFWCWQLLCFWKLQCSRDAFFLLKAIWVQFKTYISAITIDMDFNFRLKEHWFILFGFYKGCVLPALLREGALCKALGKNDRWLLVLNWALHAVSSLSGHLNSA